MTRTTAAGFVAFLVALGCGGRSGILPVERPDDGGTAGSSGTSATGGSAGVAPSGGNGGVAVTGGAAGTPALGGTSGTAGSGPVFCDGFEVDLLTSPLHCGECGNDCRGGGCNAGRCSTAPIVLADSAYDPRPGTLGVAIALDRTRVYFAEGDTGRIRSVGKDGSDLVDHATGLAGPCEIVVSDEFIYAATCGDARVQRVPKRGGPPVAFAFTAPDAKLAFSNGGLYVAAAGAIVRVSEDEGTTRLVAQPQAVWPLWDLQADEALVYWPVRDLGTDVNGIYAASPDGLDLGRLGPIDDPLHFALASRGLFATTGGLPGVGDVVGYFFTAPPVSLAHEEPNPLHIAADEAFVFYSVESYDSVLRRVPINGSRPSRALASGQFPDGGGYQTVFDLAIDDSYVYFAMGSAIKRVPK